MFDFFGYTCYSPRMMSWITILDTATWAVFIYVGVRLWMVKRQLKAINGALAAEKRARIVDRDGGRVWDIASTSTAPQRPARRS